MIRLCLAFAAAQLLDLATFLQAPHLEANPFVAGQPVEEVVAGKVALIAIAWCLALLSPGWRRRGSRGLLELALILGIAVGCFGAGTNVATLSTVRAAEVPRPAPEPAPLRDGRSGVEKDVDETPVTPERTAPPATASVPRGTASWYAATGLIAAAGPELRRALGADWRGSQVRVTAGGRAVVVRLTDWCQCYQDEAGERLIDLSDDAFRRLAPLSRGLVDVRIELLP